MCLGWLKDNWVINKKSTKGGGQKIVQGVDRGLYRGDKKKQVRLRNLKWDGETHRGDGKCVGG